MLEFDSLYKRLTPAHISLTAWLPNNNDATKCNLTQIKYSESQGNHCVATKVVKQGDVVLVEDPFVRQLNHNLLRERCYNCFREIKKGVSCHVKNCRWKIKYCSTFCEQNGWSSRHAWTCRFPELQTAELQDVLFAFEGYIASRAKGVDTLPGLVSNIDANKSKDEYKMKLKKISPLFYLTEHAIESIICIFSQIRCNSFAIKHAASIPVKSNLVVSRESVYLGQAVYLNASRFNHACNPNALAVFNNIHNPCLIQIQSNTATTNVGEEITISYGPLATKLSKEERQKTLRNDYFFTCQCESCQENTDSPDRIYKCQICKTGRLYRQQQKCDHCEQPPYWAFFLKTEAEIEHFTQYRDFLKVLQAQEKIYHENTLKIGETLDRLAQVHCVAGQFQMAAKYSKRSLEVTRKVYGKISLEVAEEMMKLSTLLFNSMQKPEALRHINETMVVYKTLKLDKSAPEDIEELEDMKNHLLYLVH